MASGKRKRKKELEKEGDTYFPEPVEVTDTLDLHGFFPEQVPEILDGFIENARELGIETVRIVHGRGKSVLKRVVAAELEKHPLVVDFEEAPPDLGGWGATLARILILNREQ